jgi:hypothetical protein
MATSNTKDALHIPMHKRIAMGEKLDGSSLQPKGQQPMNKGGGLSQAKKK